MCFPLYLSDNSVKLTVLYSFMKKALYGAQDSLLFHFVLLSLACRLGSGEGLGPALDQGSATSRFHVWFSLLSFLFSVWFYFAGDRC